MIGRRTAYLCEKVSLSVHIQLVRSANVQVFNDDIMFLLVGNDLANQIFISSS
jgi:hypothetical protein